MAEPWTAEGLQKWRECGCNDCLRWLATLAEADAEHLETMRVLNEDLDAERQAREQAEWERDAAVELRVDVLCDKLEQVEAEATRLREALAKYCGWPLTPAPTAQDEHQTGLGCVAHRVDESDAARSREHVCNRLCELSR